MVMVRETDRLRASRTRWDAMQMAIKDFIKAATPAGLYSAPSTATTIMASKNPAFAAASKKEYGMDYYLRSALAGGICCGATHGAVTPVDVVKVREGTHE